VEVTASIRGQWKTLTAIPAGTNTYRAEVPAEMVVPGFLEYRIMVYDSKDTTTFPGGRKGDPWSWENRDNATYTIRLVPENSPLILWDAETDWESTYKIWNRTVDLKPTNDGGTALSIQLKQLPDEDPENKNDRSYAFKFYFAEKIKGRSEELLQKKYLVVKASNLLPVEQPVEIGLIDRNGSVFAGQASLDKNSKVLRIPLNTFKTAPFLVLPRPFPDFLPFKVPSGSKTFDWSSAEALQLMVMPGKQSNTDLQIEKIWLE